jgi:hypothetical protein
MTTHERCWLCAFFQEGRCTQTWRLIIHVEPTGGQVDFQTAPGMVPEELKPRITHYMERWLSKVLPAIEVLPIWDEIREWQLAHPEAQGCPGRKEREDLKPYLHLVKAPL